MTLGTLDEAQAIFDKCGDVFRQDPFDPPEGWEYIGDGGTRFVYLSPSGVVYKVCREYEDDEPSVNDIEHINLRNIEKGGKLPPKWKVPKTHLHSFTRTYTRWNWKKRQEELQEGRVVILATEYVKGKLLGGRDEEGIEDMEDAFRSVGLYDTDGGNAVACQDGTYYIIDAGE